MPWALEDTFTSEEHVATIMKMKPASCMATICAQHMSLH